MNSAWLSGSWQSHSVFGSSLNPQWKTWPLVLLHMKIWSPQAFRFHRWVWCLDTRLWSSISLRVDRLTKSWDGDQQTESVRASKAGHCHSWSSSTQQSNDRWAAGVKAQRLHWPWAQARGICPPTRPPLNPVTSPAQRQPKHDGDSSQRQHRTIPDARWSFLTYQHNNQKRSALQHQTWEKAVPTPAEPPQCWVLSMMHIYNLVFTKTLTQANSIQLRVC